MKNQTIVRTAVIAAVCLKGYSPAWAQELKSVKPILLPSNYKQLAVEAQQRGAKVLQEAGQWTEKGVLLAKDGRYSEAVDAYDKSDAILLQNNFVKDHHYVTAGKAHIFALMGRTEEAIGAYRSVLYRQLEKGEGGDTLILDGHSLMEFALLLQQSGKYEEARTVYEKGFPAVNGWRTGEWVLEHFEPGNVNPKRFLASVYVGLALTVKNDPFLPTWQEGKPNRATELEYTYYQQALKLHPTYALAHYYLAETIKVRNYELGRTGPAVWQESKDEYKKAAQYGRGKVKTEAEKYL